MINNFDGEPIEQAIQRISETVAEAAKQHEGPVLFVGHGAALTAAIKRWLVNHYQNYGQWAGC